MTWALTPSHTIRSPWEEVKGLHRFKSDYAIGLNDGPRLFKVNLIQKLGSIQVLVGEYYVDLEAGPGILIVKIEFVHGRKHHSPSMILAPLRGTC